MKKYKVRVALLVALALFYNNTNVSEADEILLDAVEVQDSVEIQDDMVLNEEIALLTGETFNEASEAVTATQSWKYCFTDNKKTSEGTRLKVWNLPNVGVLYYYKVKPQAKIAGNYVDVATAIKVYKSTSNSTGEGNGIVTLNSEVILGAGTRVRLGYTIDSSNSSVKSDDGVLKFYF